MSIFSNTNIDISDFLRLTNAGLRVASFTQIRAALIDRYKSVYGSDIDLSTASADGIFVNDLALIINNILQVMNTMYANLDVSTASGVYLDTLCAFSNVTRRQATSSTASLIVTNISNGSITIVANDDSQFTDKAGNGWASSIDYVIPAGQSMTINVYCSTEGAVSAPIGWIQTVNTALVVEQTEDALVGNDIESDASLRARHAQSAASFGTTTLSSLGGALLDLNGVEDVYIYNNNSNTDETMSDGVTVDKHSIYVVIRIKDGVTVKDSLIGDIIYEKLTPGIHSCDATGATYGTDKSYEYVESVAGFLSTDISQQEVYWKQAIPKNESITINVTALQYFSTDELGKIAEYVNAWLNTINIGVAIDTNQLVIKVLEADPRFKGITTFTTTVSDVTVSDATNELTYFNYTKYALKWNGTVTPEGGVAITMTSGAFTIGTDSYVLYNNSVNDTTNSLWYEVTDNKFTVNNVEYTIATTSITKDTSKYQIVLC